MLKDQCYLFLLFARRSSRGGGFWVQEKFLAPIIDEPQPETLSGPESPFTLLCFCLVGEKTTNAMIVAGLEPSLMDSANPSKSVSLTRKDL